MKTYRSSKTGLLPHILRNTTIFLCLCAPTCAAWGQFADDEYSRTPFVGTVPSQGGRALAPPAQEYAVVPTVLNLPPLHQENPTAGDLLPDSVVQPVSFQQPAVVGSLDDFAWRKGAFKIVPYGSLWGSMSYETSRTAPGAYTLFVPSIEDQGEDAFHIDTRRTRFGVDIAGPPIPMFLGAKSRGKLEIDFHGAFVVENKPGVLLRHAYAEVYDDDFHLLAGQTWDLISPLNPHTINYSVGWGGGNIGYRRMQIRYERYIAFSDVLRIDPGISINQNIVSDFRATTGVTPEASSWPLMEGRLGFVVGPRGKGCLPMTFGVSGHIGAQGFDFADTVDNSGNIIRPGQDDARITTWSLNADVRIPLTDRFGVQGEFFTGKDLSTFLGGIVQGVDLTTREGIRATGGWFEVWYDCTSRLHLHSGYSLDDPLDTDLQSGNGRTYNHYYFANSIFDVTKQLLVGFEVSVWKTNWQNKQPGDSVRFEFGGQYNF